MRYFHRTSLSPDDVLAEADSYFSKFGSVEKSDKRGRVFGGSMGKVSLVVQPEGGHYTRVTLDTDGSNEGEFEKVSKRFFTSVHGKAHPAHVPRGRY